MSRADQINAELAANVDPKIQRMALSFMTSPLAGPHGYTMSEDEAIIITDRIFKKIHADQNTTVNIAGGISVACIFVGIVAQLWIVLLGIGAAVIWAYWNIQQIRGSSSQKMIDAFELYRAKEPQNPQQGNAQAKPQETSAFDVPPQD